MIHSNMSLIYITTSHVVCTYFMLSSFWILTHNSLFCMLKKDLIVLLCLTSLWPRLHLHRLKHKVNSFCGLHLIITHINRPSQPVQFLPEKLSDFKMLLIGNDWYKPISYILNAMCASYAHVCHSVKASLLELGDVIFAICC